MVAPVLPQTPSFSLKGKRALVTGASRGIGLAAAAACAQAGAHVILAARTLDTLKDVAEALTEQGYSATALALDVSDVDSVIRVVRDIGPLDILVNSAGLSRHRPFLDIDQENYDAVMRVNTRAAYFLAQTVAKGMVERKSSGSIIQVSSQMGLVGGQRRTVYCASKHALEGMTKAMAIELGSHGIRVNTLCPTFVETDLTRAQLSDPEFRHQVVSKIHLGRLATVEDLMGPIVFLASDASKMMTGTALLVDGGWTAE